MISETETFLLVKLSTFREDQDFKPSIQSRSIQTLENVLVL